MAEHLTTYRHIHTTSAFNSSTCNWGETVAFRNMDPLITEPGPVTTRRQTDPHKDMGRVEVVQAKDAANSLSNG